MPGWFAFFDLICALTAAGLWFLAPAGMPWTLPLSLGLAPWIVRLLLSGRLSRRTPFDVPLLLFLLTAGVSVWAAYDRETAWQKFWLIVGGILLYYALANARSLWPRHGPAAADLRLWGLAGFGVALALYFTATHDWQGAPSPVALIDQWGMWLQRFLPALPGHRLNANVTAGMLVLIVPFAAALILTAGQLPRRPGFWQVVAGAALLFILLALVLTVSRGAWLALAGALALFCLWRIAGWLGRITLPQKRRLSRRYRFRRQRLLFGLTLAVPLALAVLAVLFWSGDVALLARHWLPVLLADMNRLALWRGGLLLAADYLFTGGGLGGFVMLYSTYSLLIHVGHSFHAHNLYLDVVIAQGMPALLLLGWMWLLVGVALHRRLRPQPAGEEGPLYSPALPAAALALSVLLLHGLVDDALYGSRGLLLLFVPLAFAVPRRTGREQETAGPRRQRQLIPAALAAVCLLALLWFWRGQITGAWYANLGAVAQSQAELRHYRWPETDIQDRARQEADLTTAVAHFERALEANPRQATAHRRLGLIALSRGAYATALAHLQTAYQVTPWDQATRQWLGEAYVVNGRVAEGAALWGTLLNQNNQLGIRAYWYQQLDDPQRATWVQEALALAGEGR